LGIPPHEPIAQYIDEKGERRFIEDTDVHTILREAARVKLGIKNEEILSKWSTHSLRVTAANELHRLGFDSLFIQFRLRWKSDAFMKYLRHTIHVARKHTAIMALNAENLQLRKSNLTKVNEKMQKLKVYRGPGADDILWENRFYAVAA